MAAGPCFSTRGSVRLSRRFRGSFRYTSENVAATIPAALIGVIREVNSSFESVDPKLDVGFVVPLAVDLRHRNCAQVVALGQYSFRGKSRRVFVEQIRAPLVYFRHLEKEEQNMDAR